VRRGAYAALLVATLVPAGVVDAGAVTGGDSAGGTTASSTTVSTSPSAPAGVDPGLYQWAIQVNSILAPCDEAFFKMTTLMHGDWDVTAQDMPTAATIAQQRCNSARTTLLSMAQESITTTDQAQAWENATNTAMREWLTAGQVLSDRSASYTFLDGAGQSMVAQAGAYWVELNIYLQTLGVKLN
jgi:hypothetical protein